MVVSWDPYREWLGIASQLSPTWYELLAVSPAEQDAERIEAAYQRRYALVRVNQIGPYKSEALRILHELTQAYLGLLDPELRREYDQRLASLAAGSPSPPPSREPSDLSPKGPRVVAVDGRPEEVATQRVVDERTSGRLACGACDYRFGAEIGPPIRVGLTTDDDVVSEPLVVHTRVDWWRNHAEIEASASLWSRSPHDSCLHRTGVALLAMGCLFPVMALVSLRAGSDGTARWQWLGATMALASLATAALARFYRPRFASGVDWVWTRLIPEWLSEPPQAERLWLLTAIARLSVGRGDRRLRRGVVENALGWLRKGIRHGDATGVQLGTMSRLALIEWTRDPDFAPRLPCLLHELAEGHLRRQWTHEVLDLALRDGQVLLWSRAEFRLFYEAAILTAAVKVGLRVADVTRWAGESTGIRAVLGNEVAIRRKAGLWFAAQRLPLPQICRESLRTAWRLVSEGRGEDLLRGKNAWLASADGRLIVTEEGVRLEDIPVRDARQVTWRQRTGREPGGAPFELIVGTRRLPCAASPAQRVQQTVQLFDWWTQVVASVPGIVAEPPRWPTDRDWKRTRVRCPNCGSAVCGRTGEVMND